MTISKTDFINGLPNKTTMEISYLLERANDVLLNKAVHPNKVIEDATFVFMECERELRIRRK